MVSYGILEWKVSQEGDISNSLGVGWV